MKISVFSIATGQILRQCSVPAGMASLQCAPGIEDWIEGHFADDQFYVENFQPVAMLTKPSEYHVFDYTTKQWIDPRTPETEWSIVRATRDRLLQQSDWAALPDVPLTTEKRAEWAAYRQALRDVTTQSDPFNIVWPTPPQ